MKTSGSGSAAQGCRAVTELDAGDVLLKIQRAQVAGVEDAVDDAGRAHPLVGLAAQLARAGGGQGVEARPAVVVGGADARLDPATLLEAQQRRIESALIERQQRAGDLLDALSDAVSVERTERVQRLEDEEVECAAEDFGLVGASKRLRD